jgi:FKBP-type peptidyl-prolyl cis-trans isomerase 2
LKYNAIIIGSMKVVTMRESQRFVDPNAMLAGKALMLKYIT